LLKHKKRLRKYGKKPGTQCVRRNLIGSRKWLDAWPQKGTRTMGIKNN
jgi:hypothetical protein